MQRVTALLGVYLVLIVFDLIPQIRRKKWEGFWFIIPAYTVIFILEMLEIVGIFDYNLYPLLNKVFGAFKFS